MAEHIISSFPVKSWSFDKGFWHKDNKELLKEHVEKVIMPKKGKCNKTEQAEEGQRYFKLLRNKHSAVESNINELECRGWTGVPTGVTQTSSDISGWLSRHITCGVLDKS